MKRRTLVMALSGTATTWSAGRAQQKTIPRVVYLWPGPPGSDAADLKGLQVGLRDLGYDEGRNLVVDYLYANGDAGRLAELAVAAIALQPDLVFTSGDGGIAAIAKLSRTVPIVAISTDIVAAGFAGSLARPGGNVSGMTIAAGPELVEKWLELLLEVVPGARHVAVLRGLRDRLGAEGNGRLHAMADRRAGGLNIDDYAIGTESDIGVKLEAIRRAAPDVLIVQFLAILISKAADIAALQLPAISGDQHFAEAGLLMSYGPDIPDIYRRSARHIDRILKGAKPESLPIEQPIKFKFVINMKTARALGLTIPPTLLARADELIE